MLRAGGRGTIPPGPIRGKLRATARGNDHGATGQPGGAGNRRGGWDRLGDRTALRRRRPPRGDRRPAGGGGRGQGGGAGRGASRPRLRRGGGGAGGGSGRAGG